MNRLKELLDDHETGMSKFQDDYLVTARAGGNLWGMYVQSLRELYRRFRGLREIYCDLEKNQIDIDELEYLLNQDNFEDNYEKRRKELDYKRKIMQMEEGERVLKDTKREFINFYKQASYFKDQLGDLTPERKQQLDEEYWEYNLKETIVIDFIANGRLRNTTYEMLQSVPEDMKLRVMKEIIDKEKLIQWFETRPQIMIPEKFPEVQVDWNLISFESDIKEIVRYSST
jgi:hypothetical protein